AVFALLVYTRYSVDLYALIIAFATGFLVTGASMIVNDVVDLEVDRVNKPWKPLPRGDVSAGASLVLAALFVSIALLANVLLGLKTVLVTLAYSTIGLSYSFLRGKWWSHFLVAASTTGPILYGYMASNAPPGDFYFTVFFTIVVFTVTLGREFLKAIQDVEGDAKIGYRTIATTLGVDKASKVMLATGITGSTLGVLSTLLETSALYKALITAAAAMYSYSIINAHKHRENKLKLEKPRKTTLIAMFTGILAFWLSKT
ncbi:MAG: geranylgeranylglycerol-phosphate geranylgeranyltransferase, partial [Desulfurococcaceae archaeon]